MTYDDIDPTLREFLGAHQAFRKLGFASEDIYCAPVKSYLNNGVMSCFCVLQTQGKIFTLECGPISGGDDEKFIKEYVKVAKEISSGHMPESELSRLWEECLARKQSMELLMALARKDIKIPKVAEERHKNGGGSDG